MVKNRIFASVVVSAVFFFAASAYAIQGDLDGSGFVDGTDLAILSNSFGLDAASPNWMQEADIVTSGIVDGVDLSSLAPNFGMKDGVGSVAAKIVWDEEPSGRRMSKSAGFSDKSPLVAKVADINTVFINISAADMTPMSKSFTYSAMMGAINGVPPGIRTLTVTGEDAGGTAIYKGTKTITVIAGATTTVTVYATAIDLTDSVVPKLAGGFGHSLALKSDGTIWAWGLNDVGQFGDSTQASSSVPIDTNQVETNQTGYIDLDSERHHAVGIRFNGTVWTWGGNDCGQLGNAVDLTGYPCPPNILTPTYSEQSPVRVFNDSSGNPFDNVTAVSAGALHVSALKNDGSVWTWGSNFFGQLGDNDNTGAHKSAPVQVKESVTFNNLTAVVEISAGGAHTLALKADGTVWAWGDNDNGQIGNGVPPGNNVKVATKVGTAFLPLTGIADVSAGAYHSVALANDGTVWAWGDNEGGQLGLGFTNITAVTSPVLVRNPGGSGSLADIKSIAAGDYFTLALANDGTLYAWGKNDLGQLGNGTTEDSSLPFIVTGITGTVKAIFVGNEHALVMTTDGTVWTWGNNESGQIGDGTSGDGDIATFEFVSTPQNIGLDLLP